MFRPSAETSPIGFVDNNAICCGCRDERKSIRSLRPSRIEVEGNVGEEVSEDGEEEGQMSAYCQQLVLVDIFGSGGRV
jgi:hypothetical protein